MDTLDLLLVAGRPFKALAHVPKRLGRVTRVGDEVRPGAVGTSREAVADVWRAVESAYRTGLYPAVQLCILRDGAPVIDRAIGYARGAGPSEEAHASRVPVALDTPFLLYSASKAVTAMVVHKLDEERALHVDDRVADYLPEFRSNDKAGITLRHLLAHRAGIPNMPRSAMDLDALGDPARIVQLLASSRPVFRPGTRLAYHAISSGFVLGEVVRRATGQDLRQVLRKRIAEPLGLRWLSYGVDPDELGQVARDCVTGFPVWPPFSWAFRRALGTDFRSVVEMAQDPRFLTGIVPSANVVATAREVAAFYQCLLNGGELEGVRVFDPRTVSRATVEEAYWEFDLTLGLPLRYGPGFMLGGPISLFGPHTERAFGHLGFTNIFSWADPDRRLAVALLTSGKPFLSLDVLRLLDLIRRISRAFPRL